MSKKISVTAMVRAKAQARFDNRSATKQDEVMMALFDEVSEQRERICALSLKVSMLEMSCNAVRVSDELSTIMYGKSKEKFLA